MAVITDRLQEAVTAAFINHTAKNRLMKTHLIAAKQHRILQILLQKAHTIVIAVNHIQQTILPIVLQRQTALLKKAAVQKATHIILMTTDTMIFIWMGTMIMTDTTVTAIMQMA